MKIPPLYPIIDADSLSGGSEDGTSLQIVCAHALALAEAGCSMLQYSASRLVAREVLAQARELRRLLPGVVLIMNVRADLCLAANFDGVHLGQDDLSPEGARRVVGAERIVGLSTSSPGQIAEAALKPVDYLAIGPVFSVGDKQNRGPVIGVDGVAAARRQLSVSGSSLPLVAFGGIKRANAEAVLKAGADAVEVMESPALRKQQRWIGGAFSGQ